MVPTPGPYERLAKTQNYSSLADEYPYSEGTESLEDDQIHRYHVQLFDAFRNVSNPNVNFEDDKFTSCFYEYVKDVLNPKSVAGGCPVKFDGISCWPKTVPGTLKYIPCFEELNGIPYDTTANASHLCKDDGTWEEKVSYNFCVPIQPETPTGKSIKLIFYTGNSISLVAVILALWIFISFKDLRCLRNTIHTNLLATFLLHNLFWIASASLQSHVGVFFGCSFFVALNYSTLTNFFWMFVEGLYLYMLVVKTFSVENIKLRVYVLIGWGAAVPIVIGWLIVRLHVPAKPLSAADAEVLKEACWLLAESETDWIIRSPVLVVLTLNILFLGRIMWVLITKLRSANTLETKRYWKATKALLVLIPLLGLTYMLLIALPQEFEYFRAVLLSSQGFLVALFYCFFNSEVRNSIRHHIQRWQTERGIAQDRGTSIRHSREQSQRSHTGRFSGYGRRLFGGKRESLCCSEVTTVTTFVTNGYNSVTTSANPHSAAVALKLSSSPQPGHSSQLSLTMHPLTRSQTPSPSAVSNTLLEMPETLEGAGVNDALL